MKKNNNNNVKSLKNHTDSYIHISWVQLGLFLLFCFGIFLLVLNFLLLKNVGAELGVWDLLFTDSEVVSSVSQLIVIYPIICQYLLISFTLITFVAFLKNGYNNLKPLSDNGLIYGLIGWLIYGLIGWLIFGILGEFNE